VRQPSRRQAAALASRLAPAWRARETDAEPSGRGLDPDIEPRFAALDERIEHLEAALEGLQDALYRQSVRADEQHAEMSERTDPGRLAQELNADARRRGL
jgi:uncharacterized coiled-coil protein SlyX